MLNFIIFNKQKLTMLIKLATIKQVFFIFNNIIIKNKNKLSLKISS